MRLDDATPRLVRRTVPGGGWGAPQEFQLQTYSRILCLEPDSSNGECGYEVNEARGMRTRKRETRECNDNSRGLQEAFQEVSPGALPGGSRELSGDSLGKLMGAPERSLQDIAGASNKPGGGQRNSWGAQG